MHTKIKEVIWSDVGKVEHDRGVNLASCGINTDIADVMYACTMMHNMNLEDKYVETQFWFPSSSIMRLGKDFTFVDLT